MSRIGHGAGVPWGWLAAFLFVLTIPVSNWALVNVGFDCRPGAPCVLPVWPGVDAPSSVLLIGVALVLRDAVHHYLGALWAMACVVVGALLSGLLSEPSLVIASAAAFLFSETADLLVYAPLRRRWPVWAIIASGLVGSVIDSIIFLSLAFGSIEWLYGQTLGKFEMSLLVALLILIWRRARPASPAPAV